MASLARSTTIILIVIAASTVLSSAWAQVPEPVVDPEITVILQRAQTELANLEGQIMREEERLARIEAELILLRRQRSILFSAQSAFELGEVPHIP